MIKRPIFTSILITGLVRMFYLLQLSASPFFAQPLLDQHYYHLSARQLAGAGGNIIDGFRPILYPLFLSTFYKCDLDGGMVLALFAQFALGIITAGLVAWLATRLFNSRAAGLISGLLFGCSAPPLFFEGQLLITTLFTFLIVFIWILMFKGVNSKSSSCCSFLWLACGAALGLAAQARPNALPLILFAPALTLFRLFRSTYGSRKLKLRHSWSPLLAIPGLLIAQALFGIVNMQYSGTFSFMTHAGGINFYLGNSSMADGMVPRQDRHVVYEGEYRDPIQVMAEQGYRESTGVTGLIPQKDISDFWKKKTIEGIQADPVRWLRLMSKKTWLMLWNHEVPNNRSFQFAATHDTAMLFWLPVRWWLLLVLFPWGIAALLKEGRAEYILWIGSFFILFSGTIILFFVNSRFRIPLWPGMAVVAGGGALHLWRSIRNRSIEKTPVIFSLILLPLSLINGFGIPPDSIENDLSMRANLYYEEGSLDEAVMDIFQCLDIAPANPRYHFILGNILLASGQNIPAISAYQNAIKLNPADPVFHSNLGIAFENSGQPEKAEKAYRKAIELQPGNRSARTNLMLLQLLQGNTEQAAALLSDLLKNDPDNSTLRCAEAILTYRKTGNKQALEHASILNRDLAEQLTEPKR